MRVTNLDSLKLQTEEEILTQAGVVKIVSSSWSAILDRNTCDFCLDRDGLTVPANSEEFTNYQMPSHPACRCIWVSTTTKDLNPPPINWTVPSEDLVKQFAPAFTTLPTKEISNTKVLPVKKEREDD